MKNIGVCNNSSYYFEWGTCYYNCNGYGSLISCSNLFCGISSNVCDEIPNTISKDVVRNAIPKVGVSNYESFRSDFLSKYNSLSSDPKSASVANINNLRNNRTRLIPNYLLINILPQLSKIYTTTSRTEIFDIAFNTLNTLVSKLNTTVSSFNLSSFTLQAVLNKANDCKTTNLVECSRSVISILSNADATGLISAAASILNDCLLY